MAITLGNTDINSAIYFDGTNVGIGTSTIPATLSVFGGVRSWTGTGTGVGGAGYSYYQFGNSTTASENWHLVSNGDGTFRLFNGNQGSGTEKMRWYSDSQGQSVEIYNATLRIDSGKAFFRLTSTASYLLFQEGAGNSGLYWDPNSTQFSIWTNTGMRTAWNSNGLYVTTLPSTASGANMYVWTGSNPQSGLVFISTSSARYKTDIEDVWDDKVDNVLKLRPIWYRSNTEHDRKDWSWYGFIAEEVEAIEPRLVSYGYHEEDYDVDEEGKKTLKEGAVETPNGVQYDRMVVLLTSMIQKQQKQIDELRAEIDTLKAV